MHIVSDSTKGDIIKSAALESRISNLYRQWQG